MSFNANYWFETVENKCEIFFRRIKHSLPLIAKLCVLSTFLEDSLRMVYQWKEQRDYFHGEWGFGNLIGTLCVIIVFLGQIVPSSMIIINKKTSSCCLFLVGIIIFQVVLYNIMTSISYIVRAMSLIGGLVLLHTNEICKNEQDSDRRAISMSMFTSGENNMKKYYQLAGRIMLVMMFVSWSILEWSTASLFEVVMIIFSSIIVIVVLIGYKTSIGALFAIIWLSLEAFIAHPFWLHPYHSYKHDLHRYNFFQLMSIVGGLLFLLSVGPGEMSIDKKKKSW